MEFNELNNLELQLEESREQTKMYKTINRDLSQKIQLLKIEKNALQNEMTKMQEDMLKERTKSSELRLYIREMNMQCINFFNSFHSSTRKIADSALIDFSAFNLLNNIDNTNVSPQPQEISERIVPAQVNGYLVARETISNSNRLQILNDATPIESPIPGNNILNTIIEESMIASPNFVAAITSTPFIRNIPIALEEDENENDLTDEQNNNTSNQRFNSKSLTKNDSENETEKYSANLTNTAYQNIIAEVMAPISSNSSSTPISKSCFVKVRRLTEDEVRALENSNPAIDDENNETESDFETKREIKRRTRKRKSVGTYKRRSTGKLKSSPNKSNDDRPPKRAARPTFTLAERSVKTKMRK